MQPAEVCRHGAEGAGKTVIVFFGMIASGKSTLAQAWAQQHRAPYYNTDRVRKELAGLQPTERRPEAADEGIYAAGFTERTYRTMLERAAADFSRGAGMVVLDGSYSRRTDREAVRRMAAGCGARGVFVLCACSERRCNAGSPCAPGITRGFRRALGDLSASAGGFRAAGCRGAGLPAHRYRTGSHRPAGRTDRPTRPLSGEIRPGGLIPASRPVLPGRRAPSLHPRLPRRCRGLPGPWS